MYLFNSFHLIAALFYLVFRFSEHQLFRENSHAYIRLFSFVSGSRPTLRYAILFLENSFVLGPCLTLRYAFYSFLEYISTISETRSTLTHENYMKINWFREHVPRWDTPVCLQKNSLVSGSRPTLRYAFFFLINWFRELVPRSNTPVIYFYSSLTI